MRVLWLLLLCSCSHTAAFHNAACADNIFVYNSLGFEKKVMLSSVTSDLNTTSLACSYSTHDPQYDINVRIMNK